MKHIIDAFLPGWLHPLKQTLQAVTPAMSAAERRHAAIAALLGISFSLWALNGLPGHAFWLLAPTGASAIILFGMPASPVAQPWPVVGSYAAACLAGFLGASLLPWPPLAAGFAVGLCLWLMARLNCIHPPGGALALLIVLDQKHFMSSGLHTLELVAANVCLLLASAVIINNLIPGRRYPNRAAAAAPNAQSTQDPAPLQRTDLDHEDLASAIRAMGIFVDVSEEALGRLYELAIDHAFSRHVGLRCADVMSRDIVTADADMTLADAWQRLRQHQIKALPVVDAERRLTGIITLADCAGLSATGASDSLPRMAWRQRRVGDVMTSRVFTARPEDTMASLVRDVARSGRHHVPVVDDAGRLVGLLTQSDMIAALYRQLALHARPADSE